MQTSNFRSAGKLDKAISISRGTPAWFKGKRYEPLAPTREMLKMKIGEYDRHYDAQLAELDPHQVLKDLVDLAGEGAILLCWETFNVRCHRRRVAEWIETATGLIIPEYLHERAESVPYTEQPLKPSVKKKKEKTEAQSALF